MEIQKKLNDIFFEKRLSTIKNIKIKNYLFLFFNVKNILIKIFVFLFSILFFSLFFFFLRKHFLENYTIDVIPNTGAAFGILEDNIIASYVLKIIPTLILLFIFIFNNDWYIYVLVFIILINSFLNITDKIIDDYPIGIEVPETPKIPWKDAVVDYIPLFNSTCNIADVFICISVPLLVIGLIYKFYILNKKDKHEKDNSKEA